MATNYYFMTYVKERYECQEVFDKKIISNILVPSKSEVHPPAENVELYREMVLKNEAMLSGHVEELNNRHTAFHLKFSRVGADRNSVDKLGEDIHKLLKIKPQRVFGPVSAGGLLAYPINSLFEGECGYFDIDSKCLPNSVRDGYEIRNGENVLIVNDIYTFNDPCIQRMMNLVNSNGGKAIGIAVFATRGEGAADYLDSFSRIHKIPALSLAHLDIESFDSGSCRMCSSGHKPTTLRTLAYNS